MGQNNSVSGTVNFKDVVVDERYVAKRNTGGLGTVLRTGLTWPQIFACSYGYRYCQRCT